MRDLCFFDECQSKDELDVNLLIMSRLLVELVLHEQCTHCARHGLNFVSLAPLRTYVVKRYSSLASLLR